MRLDSELAVAIAASDYLVRQIRDDGQFVYFRTAQGEEITKKPYNMLRHSGCIWALGGFLQIDYREQVNQGCLKALEFAKREIVSCSSPETDSELLFVLDQKCTAKLGGNALAYLAFDIFNQREPRLKQGLLAGLKFFLEDTGAIKLSKFNPYSGEAADFVSEYYPGEAALALCTAGEYDVALRLATMLRTTRDKARIVQDHWLMQALELMTLHYLKQTGAEPDAAVKFCVQYLHDIYQEIFSNRVYLGRNTPVACRAEGILSYLAVLHAISDVEKYIAARVFLQQLMHELRSYQVKDGVLAGAFLDRGKARIDYTQHSLSVFSRYVGYQKAGIL